jgi:predicted component of type VI protein secretion system
MNRQLLTRWLLLLTLVVLTACASNKPHKRLKPGKPIPCPQKDC